MTGSRVFENARILWKTPSAPGNEYNFPVDIKLNGILRWQRLLYSSSREAYMPWSCFSYSADMSTGNRSATQPALPGLRRTPVFPCFSYPADVRPGIGNAVQPALSDQRRMPDSTCFRYQSDVPMGIGNGDVDTQPGPRRMPTGPCFSY